MYGIGKTVRGVRVTTDHDTASVQTITSEDDDPGPTCSSCPPPLPRPHFTSHTKGQRGAKLFLTFTCRHYHLSKTSIIYRHRQTSVICPQLQTSIIYRQFLKSIIYRELQTSIIYRTFTRQERTSPPRQHHFPPLHRPPYSQAHTKVRTLLGIMHMGSA